MDPVESFGSVSSQPLLRSSQPSIESQNMRRTQNVGAECKDGRDESVDIFRYLWRQPKLTVFFLVSIMGIRDFFFNRDGSSWIQLHDWPFVEVNRDKYTIYMKHMGYTDKPSFNPGFVFT